LSDGLLWIKVVVNNVFEEEQQLKPIKDVLCYSIGGSSNPSSSIISKTFYAIALVAYSPLCQSENVTS